MGGLVASYRVYIDGKRVGRLGRGKTKTFEVSTGLHMLNIKILYCDSGDFPVRVAPRYETKLTCRARPYGGRFDVLSHRHEWILIDLVERIAPDTGQQASP